MAGKENAAATKAYDKHVEEANRKPTTTGAKLAWPARILLFGGFPTVVGLAGILLAYVESMKNPDRRINIESDFIMPFLLALSLAIVVGFQTKGFSQTKAEPLVKWPQVKRTKVIKKVRKEHLEETEKDLAAKKVE